MLYMLCAAVAKKLQNNSPGVRRLYRKPLGKSYRGIIPLVFVFSSLCLYLIGWIEKIKNEAILYRF